MLLSFLKLEHGKETSGCVDESSALLYYALKSHVVSWILQGYHYSCTLDGFCFSSVFLQIIYFMQQLLVLLHIQPTNNLAFQNQVTQIHIFFGTRPRRVQLKKMVPLTLLSFQALSDDYAIVLLILQLTCSAFLFSRL